MATKHVYGRTIDFRFTPTVDDEDASAYSLVSSRLYSEVPTQAQRENTAAGHVAEDLAWTDLGSNEYQIQFPAQTDPNPENGADYDTYYVVTNFRFEAAGPIQYAQETIHIWRADALTSKIGTVYGDIYTRESKLETLKSAAWVTSKIANAKDEVDRKLRARGYDRRRTFNRERLNEIVELMTTAECCYDLAGEGNPFWATKAERWEKKANEAFEAAVISYDTDGDDDPEPAERTYGGAVAVMR